MTHWVVHALETDLDRFHLGPVDLDLAPGAAVAILGPSGAGKTTLLRTLAGFLPVGRGRIERDGVEISDWPPEGRALGYVPQGLGLFPHRTVDGNVRYPLEVRDAPGADARVRELLARFRLTELARRYPSRLSGGEKQRVAIARALAADPELIVWDEPWQSLDVQARYELGVVFHELRETERVPVVVVTHDPGLAFSVADSFVVLRGGRVRGQYDATALLAAPPDPFTARFVGFENVYDRATLDAPPLTPLRAWLRERAGPEGVAVRTPSLAAPGGGEAVWEGTVRSARPGPLGLTIDVHADDLMLTLRVPAPWSPPWPTLGSTVRFAIGAESLHPLGDVPAPHPRAA
jgi:putative spermidine/putrescine transport system ATP-binding protein